MRFLTVVTKHKKAWLIAIGSLLLFFLIGYLFRGWVRSSAYPFMYSLQYKNHVHGVSAESYYALGNPYWLMGKDNIEADPTTCELDRARFLKTSVTCYRFVHGEKQLTSTSDLAAYRRWVNTLSNELVRQEWAVNQEFSLVNGQPIADAGAASLDAVDNMFIIYEKHVKGMLCQVFLSYDASSGNTASVVSDFICNKTTYYFGSPY